jgi:signal transduction histidine kinase
VSAGRRGRRLGGLQARLLAWFLGAIVLAVCASVLTTWLTGEPAAESPNRIVSRHVQQRVARLWDDPPATEAYVAELRETTGLDLRVRREPPRALSRRLRSNGVVFEGGVALVPIVKQGQMVGALEVRSGIPAPQPWRVVAVLSAALVVLGAVARRVSMHLARPIEHVAATAERFGSGDLAARTGVEALPRRWVAEEVRDLGRTFDTMAERISRVVLDQRELLAAISHELRSPLGRARVALEIARERTEGGDGRVARSLDDVDRQLVEIDAILGDLLASARAGLADVRPEPRELAQWLEERARAETTGPVSVTVGQTARSVRVAIDPALLGRALHNLLANAWAHGHPRDEPLEVTLSADDAHARIAVRDRGPGFAPDVLPRAFDPFVTGTGAARSPKAHGIGLGLALVRRIVEAHGGRASAENVEAGGRVAGAIVTIELPRA